MLAAVTSAISDVLSWIGTVITSLTSTTGALYSLLPLFAVGIAISAVLLGELIAQGKLLKFGKYLKKEVNECLPQ